jgi:hypothetical protein
MNTLRHVPGIVAILVATAAPALAVPESSTSHMGIGAWLFIGFCAMIFVAQLTPAVLLLFGMVKGIFGRKEEKSSASRLT